MLNLMDMYGTQGWKKEKRKKKEDTIKFKFGRPIFATLGGGQCSSIY